MKREPWTAHLPVASAEPARPRLAIGYLPYSGIGNQYAARFIEILGEFGTVSELPRLRSVLRSPRTALRHFDLAVVNWIELDMVRGADGAFSVAGYLKVLARVLFLRCIARRLVYVRHNNYPHGTREPDVGRARRAIDRLERLFDVVLIHAGHEPAGHRVYVPHPLYRPAPRPPDAAEAALLAELPPAFYVVFGRIARYKRIERLIEHFPPGRELVVFGAVEEPDYALALQRMAGPQVRVLPGAVSEALAQALIRRSHGLIVSHAEHDMIVSGSLFYALSLGVPVFTLDSPAVGWIRERIGTAHLRVAGDVRALCAMIGRDGAPAHAPAGPAPRVAEEFGDARIKAVLREVLFP